jgi:hypothetical protein
LKTETNWHYRRNVTLQKDATRWVVHNTGKVIACINNLVLALFKQVKLDNAAQFVDSLPPIFLRLFLSWSHSFDDFVRAIHSDQTQDVIRMDI